MQPSLFSSLPVERLTHVCVLHPWKECGRVPVDYSSILPLGQVGFAAPCLVAGPAASVSSVRWLEVQALCLTAGSEVGPCVLIRWPADVSAPPSVCIGPEKLGKEG